MTIENRLARAVAVPRGGINDVMHLLHIPKPADRVESRAVCHVCLGRGKMSKEHVPPASAFNDHPLVMEHILSVPSGARQGRTRLRGNGFVQVTLCERCNTAVTAVYAHSYGKFVHRLVEAAPLYAAAGNSRAFVVREDTLFLAKSIATMILACEPLAFARNCGDLGEFVLNPTATTQPPFRVYGFLVPPRHDAGTITRMHSRVATFAPGFQFVGGEISMYPFGFLYATEVGPGYRPELLSDITHWFTTSSMQERTSGYLTLSTRLTGVGSPQATLGYGRSAAQIDYL